MLVKSPPLRIDPDIEQTHTPWHRRVLRWASQYSPWRVYYEVPYGRRSLERQLRTRSSSPIQEWEARGVAFNQVKPILEVIATELNLPNPYLLPDDPLRIVLISDYDDSPLAWLHHGLERRLGVALDVDELRSLTGDDKSTVESIVQALLRRLSRPQHS